jgi:hypothetical protein
MRIIPKEKNFPLSMGEVSESCKDLRKSSFWELLSKLLVEEQHIFKERIH